MILVDSSVWIDFFNGKPTPQRSKLRTLLDEQRIAIGDLILAEVLQGFSVDREFDAALDALRTLTVIDLGGREVAIQAARNYRALRSRGITIRKTIDVIIATRCIMSGYELLHSDKDFDPFVEHLGLRIVN